VNRRPTTTGGEALFIAALFALVLAVALAARPARAADGDTPTSGACAGAWLGLTPAADPAGPGVRIAQVDPEGPAAMAGLREGDLLLRVNETPVRSAAELAHWAARAMPGDTVVLTLDRQATISTLTLQLWGVPRRACQQRLQAAAPAPPPGDAVAPAAAVGRADGLKAMVAVGGFEVKAAGASQAIGDGLREMVVSALHQSGHFIVVERSDLRAMSSEQTLGTRADAGRHEGQAQGPEIADIMVFGAVTEFEPRAGGSSWMSPIMGTPLGIGTTIRWSQVAMDVRVVDVRTARVLGSQRIPGVARSVQGSLGGTFIAGPLAVPTGLSVYRNTPMEWAIRDCVHKSAYFVINAVDEDYFHHR